MSNPLPEAFTPDLLTLPARTYSPLRWLGVSITLAGRPDRVRGIRGRRACDWHLHARRRVLPYVRTRDGTYLADSCAAD